MKIGIAYAGILVGVFMAASCAPAPDTHDPWALYKSEEGRRTAYRSYEAAMAQWPAAFKDDWVDTEYGKTHIVVSEGEDGLPVFLTPGLFGDATMWFTNVGPLSERYRVYALDMINYAGKSEPTGKSVNTAEDYVAWFARIMDHYGYERVAVAGVSYGSWLAVAIAREMPDGIAAAILLDPAETFLPMKASFAWRGICTFAFFPSRAKYAAFFDWIGGGYSDPLADRWTEHMLDVVEFGATKMEKLPQIVIYKAEDLTMMTMPVLVLSAGKPIIYDDPFEFAAAAKKALPQAEAIVVPEAGHGLNMEKANYVNERMLAFLAENYLHTK